MAQPSITVSQLKCAVLDPEWRSAFLRGENPSTMVFGPTRQMQIFASHFHSEADHIVTWLLTQPKNISEPATENGDRFWQLVHDRFIADFLESTVREGKIEEAMAFADRMRTFCNRVVQLRQRSETFKSWQDVFLGNEFSVREVTLSADKFSVLLAGRIDAVRFDEKQQLEIVDYKLSQGANQKHDMVQLAIYSRMLELARPGCEFAGLIEYYLPGFHEVKIARTDLDALFRDLVIPVLEELFAKPPNQGAAVVPGSKPIAKSRSVGDNVADRIVAAYADFKLPVEVVSVTDAPQIFRFNIKPAPGVKVASLANRAEDLQVALSLPEPPLVKAGKGFVLLDIPKSQPDTVLLHDFLERCLACEAEEVASKVSFPIGLGVEGKPVLADLSDPNTCHGLVAGTAGSGKSELLKSIVASLIAKNTVSSLCLAIVDPKILTFTGINGCPFLTQPVITDVKPAITLLKGAVTEMERRYESLAADGQTSLKDRWNAGMSDIPYLVLVFDEFADLILADRDAKKTFEELVARIAAKGRAAGIHLLLATQRPDRNVVTGLIKANLPLKICLKVTSSTNSQIVLDEPGADQLLGRGDLLCNAGRGLVRAQSYFIPQPEFVNLCMGRNRL
jgi:FtsK/SpoIIIE family/FtsK alpha domain/PD-(D/E)XK nuclease superfamily